MKNSVAKRIANAVRKYADWYKLPADQSNHLLRLAKQSYNNMPANEREDWTLEQVMIQQLI